MAFSSKNNSILLNEYLYSPNLLLLYIFNLGHKLIAFLLSHRLMLAFLSSEPILIFTTDMNIDSAMNGIRNQNI